MFIISLIVIGVCLVLLTFVKIILAYLKFRSYLKYINDKDILQETEWLNIQFFPKKMEKAVKQKYIEINDEQYFIFLEEYKRFSYRIMFIPALVFIVYVIYMIILHS